MKIFFCGFMGSGKSTLLKKIKDAGFLTAFDLDELMSFEVSHYICKNGLEHFRVKEKETLFHFLKTQKKDFLLALGGGTLSEEVIGKIKKEGTLIWLKTSFETCYKRIEKEGDKRPLFKLGKEKLNELYIERLPLYELSDFSLNEKEQEKITNYETLLELIKS